MWTDSMPGYAAHLAWSVSAQAGVVVTNDVIAWLGHDGHVARSLSPPHAVNVRFEGGAVALGDGLLIATGTTGHSSNAAPFAFSYAVMRSASDALEWKQLDLDGDRRAPLVASGWLFSQHGQGSGELYPLDHGAPATPVPVTLAAQTDGIALGVEDKEPFLVLGHERTYELSLVSLRDGHPQPAQPLGIQSRRSLSAVVTRIAGRLVIGSDKIGDSPGVALAPLDVRAARTGEPLAIAELNSQSLRVAPTDDGFAAAWNIADDGAPVTSLTGGGSVHGLSAMLAVYDCRR